MNDPVNQAYYDLVMRVWNLGQTVESRFGPTKELLGQSIKLPATAVLDRPGMNLKIGWVELVQLIAGVHDPKAYVKYAPKSQLSLFTPQMAYGPRLRDWLPLAVHHLLTNPDSRQVITFIGRPKEMGTSDLPCTLALQFLIRDEKLQCNAFMRSLDVIKGLSYDIFMFGGLTQVMADVVHKAPGAVTIMAGSAHLYLADEAKMPKLPGRSRRFLMPVADTLEDHVDWAREQAKWEWTERPYGILLET